jgi:hypothetical protein
MKINSRRHIRGEEDGYLRSVVRRTESEEEDRFWGSRGKTNKVLGGGILAAAEDDEQMLIFLEDERVEGESTIERV